MLVILSLLSAAAPPIATTRDIEAVKPMCRRTSTYAEGRQSTVRLLNQEPPAELLLGVLRLRDGCEDPIVIRRDVGSPAAPGPVPR